MLLRKENFWEKERNSPLFSRGGIRKDTDLIMLLPKFRHMLLNARVMRKKYERAAAAGSSSDSSVDVTSASSAHPRPNHNSDVPVDQLVGEMDKLRLNQTAVSSSESLNHVGTPNASDAPLDPKHVDPATVAEMHRIFRLDAERTFLDPEHRQVLFDNLCHVYAALGDYHQGEGFVVALLSIYMKDSEIVEVIGLLNTHVLVGYFSAKPSNYVRDARVLFRLLADRRPALHAKLESLIVPEAFVSKWFIGLFIHVFDFETVADCIDYIIGDGQLFLFKLGLSFLGHFESELLATSDVSYALQLLRLDDAVVPPEHERRSELYRAILMGCFPTIYKVDLVDLSDSCNGSKVPNPCAELDLSQLESYRREVEAEMAREEERRKAFQYDDDEEIVFSDEE